MTSTTQTIGSSDAQLTQWLSKAALGDRLAFRQLYEATSPRLLGVISRIVGRTAVAEDLLQEVYIRVWKSAGQYRSDAGSPMAWLVASARYRAIDHLRSRPSRHEVMTADLPEFVDASESAKSDPAERLPDPSPGPPQRVQAKSEAQALQGCLGTLSASQQQSIAVAYFQGLSHGEVAAQMGVPLGSVKTWVRRGLIALKTCMENCGWTA